MPGCSARFCQNRREQGFLMHVFPRNPKRRSEWAAKVKRDNWEPTQYCYLCEAHFEDDQFELHRQDGKVKLKPFAVPTIFHYTKKKPSKKPRFVNEPEVTKPTNTGKKDDVKIQTKPWTLLENVCNAKNCTSLKDNMPVMLFPFPENEERCKEWMRRCRNSILDGLPARKLCSKAHLCSRHFEDSQFADSTRESLIEEALPTMFAHPLPAPTPAADEVTTSVIDSSSQEETVIVKVVNVTPVETAAVSELEQTTTTLAYEQLCLMAPQMQLPSSLWAVHRGDSDEYLAFVHTDISEPCIVVDRAVVFQKSCRASVYFNGQRVLLGMEKVNTLSEVEAILEKVNGLVIEPSSTNPAED